MVNCRVPPLEHVTPAALTSWLWTLRGSRLAPRRRCEAHMPRAPRWWLVPADSLVCTTRAAKPVRPIRLRHTQVHKWDGRVEEVSWTPRAFRLTGFLGEHEVVHLIQKASRPPPIRQELGICLSAVPKACCCDLFAHVHCDCATEPRACRDTRPPWFIQVYTGTLVF